MFATSTAQATLLRFETQANETSACAWIDFEDLQRKSLFADHAALLELARQAASEHYAAGGANAQSNPEIPEIPENPENPENHHENPTNPEKEQRPTLAVPTTPSSDLNRSRSPDSFAVNATVASEDDTDADEESSVYAVVVSGEESDAMDVSTEAADTVTDLPQHRYLPPKLIRAPSQEERAAGIYVCRHCPLCEAALHPATRFCGDCGGTTNFEHTPALLKTEDALHHVAVYHVATPTPTPPSHLSYETTTYDTPTHNTKPILPPAPSRRPPPVPATASPDLDACAVSPPQHGANANGALAAQKQVRQSVVEPQNDPKDGDPWAGAGLGQMTVNFWGDSSGPVDAPPPPPARGESTKSIPWNGFMASAQTRSIEEQTNEVEAAAETETDADLVRAATKIQAVFKGRQARKGLVGRGQPDPVVPMELDEHTQREHEAATTLQAEWRGRQARKALLEQESAALTIQAFVRQRSSKQVGSPHLQSQAGLEAEGDAATLLQPLPQRRQDKATAPASVSSDSCPASLGTLHAAGGGLCEACGMQYGPPIADCPLTMGQGHALGQSGLCACGEARRESEQGRAEREEMERGLAKEEAARETAITKMQARVRGQQERRRMQELEAGVVKIQARVRGNLARSALTAAKQQQSTRVTPPIDEVRQPETEAAHSPTEVRQPATEVPQRRDQLPEDLREFDQEVTEALTSRGAEDHTNSSSQLSVELQEARDVLARLRLATSGAERLKDELREGLQRLQSECLVQTDRLSALRRDNEELRQQQEVARNRRQMLQREVGDLLRHQGDLLALTSDQDRELEQLERQNEALRADVTSLRFSRIRNEQRHISLNIENTQMAKQVRRQERDAINADALSPHPSPAIPYHLPSGGIRASPRSQRRRHSSGRRDSDDRPSGSVADVQMANARLYQENQNLRTRLLDLDTADRVHDEPRHGVFKVTHGGRLEEHRRSRSRVSTHKHHKKHRKARSEPRHPKTQARSRKRSVDASKAGRRLDFGSTTSNGAMTVSPGMRFRVQH